MEDRRLHEDILAVVDRSAATELYETAEARVRKFFHIFVHVFFGLRDRSLDEVELSLYPPLTTPHPPPSLNVL